MENIFHFQAKNLKNSKLASNEKNLTMPTNQSQETEENDLENNNKYAKFSLDIKENHNKEESKNNFNKNVYDGKQHKLNEGLIFAK